MQSMYTNNQTQQMLNDYRTTPRDLWSMEIQSHIASTHLQKYYTVPNDEIDDEQWSLTNSIISPRATTQLHNHLEWSDMQLKSLQTLIPSSITHSHSSQENS